MVNRTRPHRWHFSNLFWIVGLHLAALLAIPFFTWANLGAALFGLFVLAPLGINVGYHRLLTHRSFVAPTWVRRALGTLGAVLGGGPPLHWVAMHRLHHRHSDTPKDPHDATRGFWYSHVLHLFELDESADGEEQLFKRYAPDLMKDPYFRWLNAYWVWPALAVLAALYLLGGWGLVLWGGVVRTVLTWHVMWFVNSAAHAWGYTNYKTGDRTKNCWWVGLLAAGEGWHNNHHAHPTAAAHGHRWWELDLSYLFIQGLAALGLARAIKRPPAKADAATDGELMREEISVLPS